MDFKTNLLLRLHRYGQLLSKDKTQNRGQGLNPGLIDLELDMELPGYSGPQKLSHDNIKLSQCNYHDYTNSTNLVARINKSINQSIDYTRTATS